jgi:hypothetical protein
MNAHIAHLKKTIDPIRAEIIGHKAFQALQSIEDFHVFMQHHVFAVWDFMSLLKALQNKLTCTTIPWMPVGDANTRFLINEIVVGEESDLDQNGVRMSHFELYLAAMRQAGCNSEELQGFLTKIKSGLSVQEALNNSSLPHTVRAFVKFTFDVIEEGKPHVLAAVFTFGREDLIPGMFMSIVNDMHSAYPEKISTFKYYLERHIEVDGDHHSHLALDMTARLCEDDLHKWQEAEEAVVKSLHHRKALWDGVFENIKAQQESSAVL